MSDPASPEPEVAFLRSQVVALQTRLCETLTQQVAQQQTVLIAAMQTNLALTQTVDKLHTIADRLAEALDKDEPPSVPGTDFGAILTSLVPYLLSSTQPKADQAKEPVPFTLPKAITDLMLNRVPRTGPQPSAQPIPDGRPESIKTVLRPRADGTGYDEITRTESVRRINPVPGAPAPAGKAQAKKTKPKESQCGRPDES